ncbi:sulfite exporter TauE/SafE family protein [Brevibacillus porteri]|uniref:Probable membrane transporter protein n=1 Tax=Brevibacillus porteri TaxID=2126350 RepID=A0ABX5FGU7_9BACL|nr:TSUP family transporter [Brevibacillus porteri]MED1801108.1 TSUP family transporter [Brevibacillus porteri]MED2131715.1 TSUP family transporter [Brevibacillus porteri]MED2743511.1 TSUP family transporter [Brevibacillus porteri]MED2817575.1 TSUP family transporter [Brevibacillus porteri]MED2897305.1 TSUP family transporter [Brevibacillus porteri]
MEMDLSTIVLLAVFGFIAAFIDSTVGGGGLISLPALLGLGMPPYLALGTNKLAGTISSATSSYTFIKSGKFDKKLMLILFPVSLIGAYFGAKTVLFVPQEFLKFLVVIMMALIFVYTLFNKRFGQDSNYKGLTKFTLGIGIPFTFLIGFYDGFFGPGTGSFFVFLMVLLFGYDFVIAAGNGRILNLASNISALFVFTMEGKVVFMTGLIMGIAMLLGANLGAKMAIKTGVRYVRPLFLVVSITLIVKMVYELIFTG